MQKSFLEKQLETYSNEYIRFMKLKYFPKYEIQTKKVSIVKADHLGFESAASASYNFDTNEHVICVSTNMELSKHIIFHEFTHLLDSELYSMNDRTRYTGLSGYTEYHASQVELAQLLGANTIDTIPSFSINTIIPTFSGEKSVVQYMQERYQHAIDLFSRSDFPANVSTLKSAIGVLFNYWGLRSICKMYSNDYSETICNTAFLNYISSIDFSALNNLMNGWLKTNEINMSIILYIKIVCSIMNDYKLT